jgi:diguanylate cyclase (GGDEF)-like protein
MFKIIFNNPGDSPDMDTESYHLVTVAHYILTSGLLVHLFLSLMFLLTDLHLAAVANVVCCFILIVAKYFNSTHRHYHAILLGFLDTFFCAIIGIILGGPKTNYELYMLIMLSFLPLMAKPSLAIRILFGCIIAISYITIMVLAPLAPPPFYKVNDGYLLFMRVSNAIIAFFVLELVVFFLALSDRRSYGKVRRMADTDPLTGLLNRRGMIESMSHSKNDCEAENLPWSVMMGDLDYFKALNDLHGHEVGDAVLKSVARAVTKALRTQDLFARWGGEEFLVFLPGIIGRELDAIANRVLDAVRNVPGPCGLTEIKITISLGTATSSPGEIEEKVIARADAALYQAKKAGRNCFEFLDAKNIS